MDTEVIKAIKIKLVDMIFTEALGLKVRVKEDNEHMNIDILRLKKIVERLEQAQDGIVTEETKRIYL